MKSLDFAYFSYLKSSFVIAASLYSSVGSASCRPNETRQEIKRDGQVIASICIENPNFTVEVKDENDKLEVFKSDVGDKLTLKDPGGEELIKTGGKTGGAQTGATNEVKDGPGGGTGGSGAPADPNSKITQEQSISTSLSLCRSEYQKAKSACLTAPAATQMSASVAQQYQNSKTNGNINVACGLSAKYSVGTGGLNGAYGYYCSSAQKSCSEACDSAINSASGADYYTIRSIESMSRECDSYASRAQAAFGQVALDMQNFAQSKACQQATQDICKLDSAKNNIMCPTEYCKDATHQQTITCLRPEAVVGMCSDAQASQNIQTCVCARNPAAAGCAQLIQNLPPASNSFPTVSGNSNSGGTGNPLWNGGLDGLSRDVEDEIGAANAAAPGSVAEMGAGSGAFGGGSPGGGGSGGANGKGGHQGEETDPEIGMKTMSGSDGSGGGYGGVMAADGSGVAGRPKDKDNDFDLNFLKKFLPQDTKRNPAHLGVDPILASAGVSAANGLSNFEKVTRKMNEMKRTLLP